MTGKEITKAVNEISEVAVMHPVGCSIEDLKADGSQIADMSRMGIAQPPGTADRDCRLIKVPKWSKTSADDETWVAEKSALVLPH